MLCLGCFHVRGSPTFPPDARVFHTTLRLREVGGRDENDLRPADTGYFWTLSGVFPQLKPEPSEAGQGRMITR